MKVEVCQEKKGQRGDATEKKKQKKQSAGAWVWKSEDESGDERERCDAKGERKK